MNFRVQLEEKVTTTEHSVKEPCRERGSVTTKSSGIAIITVATISVSFFFVLLIPSVLFIYKRCGRHDQLGNGKS